MSSKLPKISEADIKQLSNTQSFERGMSYYRGGALFEPVRQGNEIRGYCEGSGHEPYRVSATVGTSGLENISCTCPYDWGGLCKHLIALLLTWVHKPDSFHEIAPLDEMLAGRSQADLILLIKEMLKREPDLVRLLELPTPSELSRDTPLDLDAFRRQINYALNLHDRYEHPAPEATATELSALADTADRFQAGGDWANAGSLYALILEEVVPRYDEIYDEDGDVSLVLQQCAAGLEACFSSGSPNDTARRRWLEALLEAEIKDVQMGGMDLATPADQVLIEQASDEEWEWIEARVQQAIAARTDRYSSWGREALVGFLARRLAATGQEAKTDDLIFELGSSEQQAFLLIERGRFAEAVTLARRHFAELPGLVTRFADALVEAGATEQAEAYMTGLMDTRHQTTYLAWLAKHAEKTGNLSMALRLWRQSLTQSPSFQTYLTLREIAQQLGQWPATRQELLSELADKEAWQILIEVALDEENVTWALELLPKLKGWFSGGYELKVAQAAEKSQPQAALKIYVRRVQQLIEARGRGNYQEAARFLRRVRDIYNEQGQQQVWQEYIGPLRQEYSNLPALRDELNKAGL